MTISTKVLGNEIHPQGTSSRALSLSLSEMTILHNFELGRFNCANLRYKSDFNADKLGVFIILQLYYIEHAAVRGRDLLSPVHVTEC